MSSLLIRRARAGLALALLLPLLGCVTSPADDASAAKAYTPLERDGDIFANPVIQGELPTWKKPFVGLNHAPDTRVPQCLLVVDSTANRNAWITQRNSLSARGIFDALHDIEVQKLKEKGWTLIPYENSLYGARQVKEWAYAQALAGNPAGFEQLPAADQAKYLHDVVAKHYGPLHRVQVIRLLSRPSDTHGIYFGADRPWTTNGLGLFVSHDKGRESIYRVGLVDFKRDGRSEWPWANAVGSSIKYERRSQLREPDWRRLARISPESRAPASGAQADRVELGVHLSLVENFIYFLPDCRPL